MVLVEENKPADISRILSSLGFSTTVSLFLFLFFNVLDSIYCKYRLLCLIPFRLSCVDVLSMRA